MTGTAHLTIAQQPSADTLVELYELDTRPCYTIYGVQQGGGVYHWTPGTLGGAAAVFAGTTYAPMPIVGAEWEWNGQGRLPVPKLRISNLDGLAAALAIEFSDILGAVVTRTRTFAACLDGQPQADPTALFEPDVYVIDRKAEHQKAYLEFELAAAIDQRGKKLPGRQVLRDVCPFTYRKWDGAQFIPGTCPYAGSPMFTIAEASTANPALDVCSHRLTGCLKRYGNTPLPFGGFPGVALVSR